MQASRRSRRRLPRSCEECRRRKVKCDRSHPCSHCVMTKCRCLYSSGPHLPLMHPGRQVRQASPLSNYLQKSQAANGGSELSPNSRQRLGSDNSSSGFIPTATESGPVGLFRSHPPRLSQVMVSETADSTSEPPLPPPPCLQNTSTSVTEPNPVLSSRKNGNGLSSQLLRLHKSRLFGRTHWSNVVYEFKEISAFMRETTNSGGQILSSPSNAETQSLLQQCKQVSQSMKTPRPGRFLSCLEPVVSSPATADHLIHLYESNIETAFRILHRPTFHNEYEKYKTIPTEIVDVTMLKIQLVMAIGFGLCPKFSDLNGVRKMACQWLYTAQDWLSGPIEKDRLSIDSIQVQCLLILARQVLSVGGDLSWVVMGTLLRTAMQLGLHRDPRHFPGISNFEGEMRRRIWATILELNAQASLDSGTPSGISFDDFDTSPPANINDEDMTRDSSDIRHHNETILTDASLQRFLLQSLPPRLEIIRRMNGLGSNLEDECILELSTRLSEACRGIDAQVGTDVNLQTTSFKQNMASLLLRRFLLILHRPLAGRIRENALYYHSRKISFDSALALLKPKLENDAFAYLMLRGGGLFKSCLIHTSLALASELLIEIEEQGTSTYRQMILDAVREARQQWERRIKLGDTGFRLHMKLSIVLGQSEHTGEEADQQQRMAQSTKDSLELCHSLLQEHIGSELATVSSECNEWRSQDLHPTGSNGHMNLSRQSFGFEDILQMSTPDIGDFEPNILFV